MKEEAGYIMDARYFHDYTDVQRLGVNQDYCRVIVPKAGGRLVVMESGSLRLRQPPRPPAVKITPTSRSQVGPT